MNLLNPAVIEHRDKLASLFQKASPFRHVVIDHFLDQKFCERLLADFPPFDPKFAMNEAGQVGNKAVVEKIRSVSSVYAELDDFVQSRACLDLVSRITHIDALLYDPYYFGGGTHENRDGQDLDPHIDFNRHPVERWHRRLNMIIYLNHEWRDDWGGSLELHSDPRAEHDSIQYITPLFNRCVIFETNEISWHGFSRIVLPDSHKHLTRKSIALYFYTQDRPIDERADTHSTIYVDRPLPEDFVPGHTLTDHDLGVLRTLLQRRDHHNQRLYRDICALQKQLEQAQTALHAGKLGRLRYFITRLIARFQ